MEGNLPLTKGTQEHGSPFQYIGRSGKPSFKWVSKEGLQPVWKTWINTLLHSLFMKTEKTLHQPRVSTHVNFGNTGSPSIFTNRCLKREFCPGHPEFGGIAQGPANQSLQKEIKDMVLPRRTALIGRSHPPWVQRHLLKWALPKSGQQHLPSIRKPILEEALRLFNALAEVEEPMTCPCKICFGAYYGKFKQFAICPLDDPIIKIINLKNETKIYKCQFVFLTSIDQMED